MNRLQRMVRYIGPNTKKLLIGSKKQEISIQTQRVNVVPLMAHLHVGRAYIVPTASCLVRPPAVRTKPKDEVHSMAIYHCQIKIGSRRKGQSAVAAAAYRAADKIQDELTGSVADFSHKKGVVFSEISLPENVKNAHPEYYNRAVLWNAVEHAEKRSDSRLYREFEVALPTELTRDQQIDLVRDFVGGLVADGMIADWSLHDKNDGNPHAHIMTPTRPCDENGAWETKITTAYALDDNGMKIPVIDPLTGVQKVRKREGKGVEKLWVRETVYKTNWNDKSRVEEWRKKWEISVNNALKNARRSERVDCRSLKAQGIDRVPQIHVGVAAKKIAAKQEKGKRIPYEQNQKNELSIIKSYEKIRSFLFNVKAVFEGDINFLLLLDKLIRRITEAIYYIKKKGATRMTYNEMLITENETKKLINEKITSLEEEKKGLDQKKMQDEVWEIDQKVKSLQFEFGEDADHHHRHRR